MNTTVTNRVLTLPNLISIIRLLLVPFIAVSLVVYENNVAAFVLFLIAVLSDFVDGAVARSTGQVSRLGQQLDPIVDRVLIITAVIVVFIIGRVPLWIVILLVARDVVMFVFLARLGTDDRQLFKVAFIGKVATAVNMVGFCSLILNWPLIGGLGIIEAGFLPGWGASSAPLGIWFLYLGVILAWAAGIHYLLRTRNAGSRYAGGRQASTRQSANKQAAVRQSADSYHNYNRARNTRSSLASSSTRRTSSGAALDTKSFRQAGNTKRNYNQSSSQSNRRRTQESSQGSKQQNKQGNKQGAQQSKRQGGSAVLRALNTPGKLLLALAIILLLILFLGFYGCDGIRNFGVIHRGVSVGTVDVGAMKEAEAAELLHTELTLIVMQAPVHLYASEGAAIHGVTENTLELGNGVSDLNLEEDSAVVSSWSISPATLNAVINGDRLAEDAYAVGRKGDFLLGRLGANIFGANVAPRLEFSQDRLLYLEDLLTQSIGNPMVNASMHFDGGRFVVTNGNDGKVVDEEKFESMLQEAFFADAEDRVVIVPMVDRLMRVNRETARVVAENTQLAIAEPITLTYAGDSWTLRPEQLGWIITSEVLQDEKGNWNLVPSVDPELLKKIIPEMIGQLEEQVEPVNARFFVVDGGLQITPSQNGTGIIFSSLAEDMDAVLFGDGSTGGADGQAQDRTVAIQIGIIEPEITTTVAVDLDFGSRISEYTLYYPYAVYETRTNIHVAADHINSSVIAPHGIWSFNETVGECTPEKGFIDSQIILNGNYVDGIGGGVCTVASVIYNAAWEAGYPIRERVNHSLRVERYPLGRDAAVAFPWADLKFENDTDNYLLLTLTYDDESINCILWGIPPGYIVESIEGEFIESEVDFPKKEVVDENMAPGTSYLDQRGLKASKIEVTRIVYDSEGNVKEKRTIYSSYDATPEVTKVGPDR